MIIAVSGTGTGVGKTHVACALIAGLRARGLDAIGWKPVESGVIGDSPDSDEAKLRAASGSAAAAPTLRLRAPLSPHLAARREGITIDRDAIRAQLDDLVARHAVVVLELAGGLCSPFDDRIDNAEWLSELRGLRLILVAPDRLGVLHDTVATIRAAAQVGLAVHGIVLSASGTTDASTGSNAAELRARPPIRVPVIELPRAPSEALAKVDALIELALWEI